MAGATVKANHVQISNITARGDLLVEYDVYESTIEVGGRCSINQGRIIGSTIVAEKGIGAVEVGSRTAKPSSLTFGISSQVQQEAATHTATQISQREKEMKRRYVTLLDGAQKGNDAGVTVTGTIHANTEIIGPHASTVLQETHHNVIIREVFNPDAAEREDEWKIEVIAQD